MCLQLQVILYRYRRNNTMLKVVGNATYSRYLLPSSLKNFEYFFISMTISHVSCHQPSSRRFSLQFHTRMHRKQNVLLTMNKK